ncbi:hypothetical protein H5410_046564 [Solanum commersonii]|uniref:DNA-directed RNA polymerase n=1 Tax=Solanum commersonii TaxID=4109 RepID=A0A9J5XEM9_SOLCO|nr:hypothetical protein H5410_046564 [Solanum commersonii]
MEPFKDVKYHSVMKESIKTDPLIPIRNSLGPLGTCLPIKNFYSSYHLITHNQILVTKYLQFDNLKQTFQVIKLKYYLMDENGKKINPDPCHNIILNPFNLNWSFLHHNYCAETSKIISLRQFICENVCIGKNGLPLKSGQVILVQVDSIVLRSAKPYLATPGATVHGHYGETLNKGDTLITFIYEKSRYGDITQGLPKVEHVLEVRLSLPGVQIHNRHIEIIVRQITSKVLISEHGMSNVFSPKELIGWLRAERMGLTLEEAIYYRVILLGITRASLNTQSFISEASFQETAQNKKGELWGEMTRRYWNINLEEKWNPKMAPYISANRKGIHITNLTRTARFLSEACDLVFDVASKGKQFLIVGTKNKAVDSILIQDLYHLMMPCEILIQDLYHLIMPCESLET